jgi:hypothetical protein
MKKSKLVIEYDYDFELMGVTTSVKGYKLAWEINRKVGVTLVRQPDLTVGFKKGEEKLFSFYAHETLLNRLKLFKNRPNDSDTGKYYLVPEFPHFDFIILVQMEDTTSHELLLTHLKEIPAIELAAPIPLDGLKSKSNFIF